MKIGDKILVTYSNGNQFAGMIVGETAKSWKVEFDNGDDRTIRKTMDIEVIDNPKTEVDELTDEQVDEVLEEIAESDKELAEETEPYEPTKYTPSKKVKRGNVIILVGILLAIAALGAAVVFGVGLF